MTRTQTPSKHPPKTPLVNTVADPLVDVLRPGQSISLLKHLHILTREGRINQDTRRKLKQVNHLLQFIQPMLEQLHEQGVSPNVVDHGAGKSYLGFLLYDAWFTQRDTGSVWGIESRAELVKTSLVLAQEFGFKRMGFIHGDTSMALENADLPQRVDVVTALHACNTATDDAIRFGLAKSASYLVLVPCCQAQIAGLLKQNKAQAQTQTPLSELWRHALHTREFGSQLTNVLRCLQLEAAGYQVTVTELVGWEHSMKNELILAKKLPHATPHQAKARERLEQLLSTLHLNSLRTQFL